MANEAELYVELENPIPMTVADGTGIEKGALLKLSDPMTAATSDGTDDIIAGIAASEKIANDGVTKLGVYRRGIFKMTANGSISVGDLLKSDAGNAENTVISTNAAAGSTEDVVGRALESASDGDTLLVELNPTQLNWPS